MTSVHLEAVAGARRLRVCGYRADGTPLVADGAHVIELGHFARQAGVPVESVELVEAPVPWAQAVA